MSDSLLDPLAGCRAYLEAHHRQHAAQTQRKQFPVITLSREAGAGAVTIGELAAQLLNRARKEGPPWTVFDKNLVERVVADHRFPEHLKQFLPEDARAGVTSMVEEMLGLHPSAWTLAEHTTETILRLAHLGNVILVGRGANLIAAKIRPAVHVRLVAPLEERIAHNAEYYNLTQAEAAAFTRKADVGRRRYVKRYFRADIEDPLNYTLTLNTGRLDYQASAHIIAEAVRQCGA
ncbi:MAG: cytidylate kinase-like family protein [Verrucomicrobiota bacterium]